MGKPAARISDMHVCPMVSGTVPHVGGPVSGPSVPTVLIGGMPAAVMGDMCVCVGPPDTIILGSTGVFIGGKPAARMGDSTVHGGKIVVGCPTVLIGDTAPGSPVPPVLTLPVKNAVVQMLPGTASTVAQVITMKQAAIHGIPFCKKCNEAAITEVIQVANRMAEEVVKEIEYVNNYLSLSSLAKSVNPENGTNNCGKIIDAVISRLKDPKSKAVAETGLNGSWDEIENRHNVKIDWNKSFSQAYEAVKYGGNGTTGIIGIQYGDGVTAHVIVITNKGGTVAIIEGQGGGKAITSAEKADKLYNNDGKSTIGFGLLGT